jgi:HEAT repeat protein
MNSYCPECWKEVAAGLAACPGCGAVLLPWNERKYSAKLIRALDDPDAETRRRAVYVIGEKRVAEAVGRLGDVFERTVDPFLKSEIVEAIGKIGGETGFPLLIEPLRHPSFVVRAEAAKALSQFFGNETVNIDLDRLLQDPAYVRELRKEAVKAFRRSQ